MRIVSGKYKGFIIQAPKLIPARPTTDRSKESLFNILNNQIELEGLKVLDLFSGTGNMAYEFASRGATEVTSVDLNYHAFQFIKETFKKLGFPAKVVKGNALQFIAKSTEQYDLVFADPPYAMPELSSIPDRVFESTLLKPDGMLILEHASQTVVQHERMVDQRIYGQSTFSFFK
ncbi:MAG: 16S rRNA (guanine(966)-N(2))-methyltransferase RsmD [Bacteroidetes bacterium]|nr:MAG: 16S rRNA (guanine(966)-N(2))-methyltransferase RsmD [Bacteroidota bacterium]